MSTQPSLGIIGFGQMGQLLADVLSAAFDIAVYDIQAIKDADFPVCGLPELAQRDYLMLAVPVQAIADTCTLLAPHLAASTLVFDIASVKEQPAQVMRAHLPAGQPVLPLHPLFGPQSYARDGLAGAPLVWCDETPLTPQTQYLWRVFENELQLRLHVMSPTAHDQHMAYVMGLTHLIGFALNRMALPTLPLETASYTHLRELRDLLSQDTLELFEAIQTLNPYAPEVTQQFREHVDQLLKS